MLFQWNKLVLHARRMLGHSALAAIYAQLGRIDEARAEAAEVLRIEPTYTINGTQKETERFQVSRARGALFDGLRKAGLPEK